MKQLTFLDLCAGIGGFRMGLEAAGHKCIGYCEYDKFAVASYRAMHHTEGEWYADDITKLKAGDIPYADIWCFGFPCQDISIAGKQRGLSGKRSGIYYNIIDLIKSKEESGKPTYLFIENVKNLLSVNGGFDFATVLSEMDEAGYDCNWQVLNSKDFGVPQNRERVFIIGNLRSRGTRDLLPVCPKSSGALKQMIGGMQGYRVYDSEGISVTLGANGGGMGAKTGLYFIDQCSIPSSLKVRNGTKLGYDIARPGDSVCLAYPKSPTRRGRVGKGCSQTLDTSCNMGTVTKSGRIRRLTPRECFRLQGFPDELFNRAAAVCSESQLYKQAGNAVTVNVAYAAALTLPESH